MCVFCFYYSLLYVAELLEEAAVRGCAVVSLQRSKPSIEYIEGFMNAIDTTQIPDVSSEEEEPEPGKKKVEDVMKKSTKNYPTRSKTKSKTKRAK